MRAPWHEFVLDEQPPDGDGLARALAPRFSLSPDGPPRHERRSWLDTFDWRLYQAGFTLELVSGTGSREFTLTGADGQHLAGPAGRARWPALASALPPGPLRERLADLAGIRALLPVVATTGEARRFRILNREDKTVARLAVERMSVTGPGGLTSVLPTRLRLTALRGYQAQTGRAAARLLGLPGAAEATMTPLQAALAAAGRSPGDYTGKVDVTLDGASPARAAAAAVLLSLLDTLEANVPGTLRDLDTEFLHDLRVSVRRTRSALKLAGDILPDGLAARYRAEFKWLGDVTTPTRDLDVYLLSYPEMAASLAAAGPADLEPLRGHLIRRRAAERRRLARALRSARFTGLTTSWRTELTTLAPAGRGPTAAALAAERIGRAHHRVLTRGAALTPGSPPERLHELRKRCKELRYALEFFASLHDPGAHRRAVRGLKRLQDSLGMYQDCQVQSSAIVMFATQMHQDPAVPATALLAMGELAGHIAARGRQARGEFEDRFAEFTGAATLEAFRSLTTRPSA